MIKYSETQEGVLISVRAMPRASRARIEGERAGALKVYVAAPPDKGRANEAVAEALADSLGIAPGRISIRSGEKSRDKTVFLGGVKGKDVQEWLSRILR